MGALGCRGGGGAQRYCITNVWPMRAGVQKPAPSSVVLAVDWQSANAGKALIHLQRAKK